MTDGKGISSACSRIAALSEKMQSDPRFQCVYEAYALLDEAGLAELEEMLGDDLGLPDFAFPGPLRQLYRQTGGFRFQWLFTGDGGEKTSGSAEIVSPLRLYQEEGEPEPTKAVLSQWRIFDRISDDEAVVLRPDAVDGAPLRLRRDDGVDQPMALGIDAYVEALADQMAIYGWQSRFVKAGGAGREAGLDEALAEVRAALEAGDGEG